MKTLKPFEIAFVGLSNGIHEFSFALGDEFFACFEGSEITKAALDGKLIMNKKNNMLDLEFVVKGKVELNCDRCLDSFWDELDIHKVFYIKFGEKYEEQSDEVLIIPSTESHIHVAHLFYEFVSLGLPVKRVHPGGESNSCDADTLEQMKKYLLDKEKNKENSDKESPTDSRWDALKNLKFN